MERQDERKKAMKKIWLKILCALCAFCAAGMLAACGSEEEMQIVEKENIAPAAPAQSEEETREDTEMSGEETAAPEEAEETTEDEKTEDEKTEDGFGQTEAAKPAVVSIETDRQEYKDGERTILVTNYDDVTVSIEGNEGAEQAVMAEFAKRKKDFEAGLMLEETLELAKENPAVDGNVYYSEEKWYAVARNDGRVLSFSTMWDTYEGGAHGQYMIYGLNFDGGTGKLLAIADIARDKGAFQEICVQEMLRQCENLKAQGALYEEEMVMPGLREILEGKMEGAEWYFTENGIRFISNIYEIAPYAAGNIDFDIPYEMINEVLKEEYRG